MSRSVTFDLKGLEKKLNQIEKVFLKEAAEKSLMSFGFESRSILAEEMKRRYTNPTQYTLRYPDLNIVDQTCGSISTMTNARISQPVNTYSQRIAPVVLGRRSRSSHPSRACCKALGQTRSPHRYPALVPAGSSCVPMEGCGR